MLTQKKITLEINTTVTASQNKTKLKQFFMKINGDETFFGYTNLR